MQEVQETTGPPVGGASPPPAPPSAAPKWQNLVASTFEVELPFKLEESIKKASANIKALPAFKL